MGNAAKVMLVDDDESLHVLMRRIVEDAGYAFCAAFDGEEGLALLAEDVYKRQLLAWAPLFGIILGIVAIVLAVKAVKEAGKDGKATGGKVCGIIGIVLSVLSFILYLVIGFGAMAYVAAHPGSVTVTENTPSLSDSGSNSSALGATEDEKQAEAVAQAELDKLKNQDPAFVQQLAAQLDAEFADSAGYSLAELGVDPVAFVQWLLADFDYQLDGTYTNSDGTGTTYADVTMCDVYAFASTFMTDATAFSRSTEAGSMDEAAMKAKLGELFNAAMEKTTDTTESYICLLYTSRCV